MVTLPEHTVSNANDSAGIRFTDLFNLDEIQRLQDLFSDATGVASIITHPDGTPITRPSNFCRLCSDIIRKTEKGRLNCYQSDAILGRLSSSGAVVQPCLSSGLWDAGAGITVDGVHIANWLIGQIRNEELDEARMIQYAEEIGADRKDFVEALNEVPVMSAKQFRRVSDMLYTFANELSEKAYNNLLLKTQITQKITAEEQFVALHDDLRRSELFLKETQKIAQLGTYVLEIKTGIWASSEILDKIFGIDPDYDKSVEGWAPIIHPEWQQLMNDYFIKEVLGNKSNFDKEYKIVQNKSKEVRWVHGIGELVYDETGQYQEHELLGKSISLVRSPRNPSDLVNKILPATLGGSWQGELLNQRKDGSEFPVFVSTSVIRDDNNVPVALIGVSEDITACKEAENEILKLNEELDHRVRQWSNFLL
jgi:PAS domain S-box-containing protein